MTAHIALFEQDPALLCRFQKLLTQAGYQVWAFEEGGDSLRRIGDFSPDLIILGNIPISAQEALQFFTGLRAQAATQQVPVIIAATSTPHVLHSPYRENQPQLQVLYKPFDRQQLLECVACALGKQKPQGAESKTWGGPQATSYG